MLPNPCRGYVKNRRTFDSSIWKWIGVLSVIGISIPAIEGSAVFLLIGEHDIVIAADGRPTDPISTSKSNACKIFEVPNLIFTIAGRNTDNDIGWDLRQAVSSAILDSKTVDAAVAALIS